jgi:cell division protein FtsW
MARFSVLILLFAVSALAAIGVIMLASTSFFLEEAGNGEAYGKLVKQGVWLGLGLIAMVGLALTHYHLLYRMRWWIFGASMIGLVLCFIPQVGVEVNGASRWISLKAIGLGVLQFQPSELAKLACAIIVAGWFARYEPLTREFVGGFLFPGGLIMIMVLLIAMEVDLGTAALVAVTGGMMMFVAGSRLIYLLPLVVAGAGSLWAVIQFMPNRVARIMAFMDLEKYKDGLGLQQWRALMAFGSGGLDGAGLGNGRQKMLYLPEAHTDFIFPMVGEELGFYGTLFVVGTFVFLVLAGMSIAKNAPDRFSRLLAFGITLTLGVEALINMGVTTALLPNKGLALPFVSYGGSGLLFAMAGIGILINIYRHSTCEQKNDLPLTRRRRMTGAAHGAL